ncbi:hypothetical protein [Owenweeksia hongkongensis]|uniref:hypothetical protein n=1 Tax=Owenweeksia hongkongensis TaxID=253245 RepID=UPI003A8D8F54
MKKMRSTLVLLLALIVFQNAQAQKNQIFFNASVLSQPNEFHFPAGWPGNGLNKQPAIEFNLGYISSIGKTNVFWEASISNQYVQSSHTFENNHQSNDPAIPDKAIFKDVSNILGLKAGIGYKIGSDKGKHSLKVVAGAAGYLPFLSKTKTKFDDGDWQKSPSYIEDNFKYGILYGFYLKPTYQLRFKRNNPWAMHIFGEANLLWRNEADYGNPLLMAGGGIGFSYSLN